MSCVIENDGRAGLFAQVAHQIENLRLNRHIERRRRFVGDQQLGGAGQRHCDHHALRLAAGYLMGIGVDAFLWFGNSDHAQQFDGALPARLPAQTLVDVQHFGNLVADFEHGVQARRGLLENHRHTIAANLGHLLFR